MASLFQETGPLVVFFYKCTFVISNWLVDQVWCLIKSPFSHLKLNLLMTEYFGFIQMRFNLLQYQDKYFN